MLPTSAIEVNRDERRADRRQVDAVVAIQEVRNPEQVQPPDRIGQELAERERPRLPMLQQRASTARGPAGPADRCGCAPARPATRAGAPPATQYESHHTTSQKKPSAPVAMNAQYQPQVMVMNGHDQRRDQRADVRAGVEDAGGERALALREPLGHDLDRRREIAGLAQAERKPRGDESGDRSAVGEADQPRGARPRRPEHAGLGVRHRREAPDDDDQREAEARAEPIHQPAGDQQPDGIGELEREHDVGVVDLGPAELRLQRRLEDADHLPVDVVDRRGDEQQAADVPAVVADPLADRRGGRRRRRSDLNRRVLHRFSRSGIRLWDCAGGWRTPDGRASQPRSGARRRRPAPRRTAARPRRRASPNRP